MVAIFAGLGKERCAAWHGLVNNMGGPCKGLERNGTRSLVRPRSGEGKNPLGCFRGHYFPTDGLLRLLIWGWGIWLFRSGDRARFPEVAEDMNAHALDFFSVAPGSGFNGFGAGIVQNTDGNGDGVSLMFVALNTEGHFALAEPLFGDFEPGIVVLHFVESGSGGGTFGEVSGIDFGAVERFEQFEDFGADDGNGGGSEASAASAGLGEVDGKLAEVFEGGDVLLVAEPAFVTGVAPVGEVLALNELAAELGGEDFFDGWEIIEPSEDMTC